MVFCRCAGNQRAPFAECGYVSLPAGCDADPEPYRTRAVRLPKAVFRVMRTDRPPAFACHQRQVLMQCPENPPRLRSSAHSHRTGAARRDWPAPGRSDIPVREVEPGASTGAEITAWPFGTQTGRSGIRRKAGMQRKWVQMETQDQILRLAARLRMRVCKFLLMSRRLKTFNIAPMQPSTIPARFEFREIYADW